MVSAAAPGAAVVVVGGGGGGGLYHHTLGLQAAHLLSLTGLKQPVSFGANSRLTTHEAIHIFNNSPTPSLQEEFCNGTVLLN